MYRGTMENKRVKREIIEALFTLLKKKGFSEITVSDIIKEAGVARSTYYRNFKTIEEIIELYIESLHDELRSVTPYADSNSIYLKENLITAFNHSFTCGLKNKSYLLALYHNGFGSMIQDIFNKYGEEMMGGMSYRSIDRYLLYFMTGAILNVLIQWLEDGAKESPLEISKTVVAMLMENVIEKLDRYEISKE